MYRSKNNTSRIEEIIRKYKLLMEYTNEHPKFFFEWKYIK